MTAGLQDGASDLVVHGLERARQMGIEPVIKAKLRVSARPRAALSCRACDGNVGLDVDRVSRGLAPLEADRTHDRKVRHRLDRKRGFDVKQVHVAGEACQRKIISVRKKWIERSEYIVTRIVIA